MAILPIETRTGNWKGNEYLELYSEMQIQSKDLDNLSSEKIVISKINGEELSLRQWLSN